MRPATLADTVEICELEYLLFPENNFNETTLAHELVLGSGWVEEVEGRVVGYMLLRMDGPLIDVIRLGVHPEHQGKGIGSALLSKTTAQPTMLTVRGDNIGALRLYVRHGFDIVGKVGLEPTGWVLARD